VSLDTTFREFCVEIIWSSWGLDNYLGVAGSKLFIALFFEVTQFLFLDDVGELFADQLQLLLVEDVDRIWVLVC